MKIQLDHLNLSVDNFALTAQWYEQVFGFEVVEEGLQDGQLWGVLRAGLGSCREAAIWSIPNHRPQMKSTRSNVARARFVWFFGGQKGGLWRRLLSIAIMGNTPQNS